ncbi:MAG: PilX N-terminal domain-containing pilus assembly protein [Steroidobacteraceae bacterium]
MNAKPIMVTHLAGTHAAAGAQRGAALVVGMVLLLILTLLAITGMNMASTELVMAGNEQYRQRADQAADLGFEQAVSQILSVSTVAAAPPTVVGPLSVPGAASETWRSVSQYVGDATSPIPGFSVGKSQPLVYSIVATGTSSRNAQTVIDAGLAHNPFTVGNQNSDTQTGL